MQDWIQQLIALAPGMAAGAKGDGDGMRAFMDAYQRTSAELEEQRRRTQVTAQQGQDRTLALEDRTRNITRQTESDARAVEDRRRRQAMEVPTISQSLAEAGGMAETPQGAESAIDALFRMMAPDLGGAEALGGVRDQAIGMAGRTITARQKRQMEEYVNKIVKDGTGIADNPDADPEIVKLSPHIVKLIGKPTARLSELQQFAELPVGKPQGKTRVPAMGGSQEDFIQKKYGDNPTPEQIIEGRRLYTDAGREPNVGGAGGLNPYQDAQFTERLAKTWNDANTSGREMRRQLGLMETGLKRFREGDKNGGSQAVLITFQKILDPTSVVRESEYARSAAGMSMLARMEGYMERLRSGGAGVPDSELAAMVETARQMLAGMQGHATTQRSRIEAQAKKHNIDPVLIFGVEQPDAIPQPSAALEPMTPATPSGGIQKTPTSGPKVGERRKFGDVLGEWNGKEWVEVKP